MSDNVKDKCKKEAALAEKCWKGCETKHPIKIKENNKLGSELCDIEYIAVRWTTHSVLVHRERQLVASSNHRSSRCEEKPCVEHLWFLLFCLLSLCQTLRIRRRNAENKQIEQTRIEQWYGIRQKKADKEYFKKYNTLENEGEVDVGEH
ncbi:hypothetical protein Q1695_003580 [Nippostrongylus brasiliensis]|nr:hypothetical protein Q1695_003580 [Nippostrongylus brasiliensis]